MKKSLSDVYNELKTLYPHLAGDLDEEIKKKWERVAIRKLTSVE